MSGSRASLFDVPQSVLEDYIRAYGAAALFAAVVAGQTSSSDAITLPGSGAGMLTVKPATDAAYNYENDPFQCLPPTVDLTVNQTHAWMLITSYSQNTNDAMGGKAPIGRSQWAWSTFMYDVAYPSFPIWDPATTARNPTLALMPATTTATGTDANKHKTSYDPYRWDGSCAVGANFDGADINTKYAKVGDITLMPTVAQGVTTFNPMHTLDLAAETFQAAGCSCPAYSIRPGGAVVDLSLDPPAGSKAFDDGGAYKCRQDIKDADTGPATATTDDVFYTVPGVKFNGYAASVVAGQVGVNQSYYTHGWTMRQSTCGASPKDSCTTTTGDTPYSHFTGRASFTAGTCSLKTEALMIMPVEQFLVRLKDSGAIKQTVIGGTTSTSTLSYVWEEYVVEYASTANNATGFNGPQGGTANTGIDTFQTRVTPARFQLNQYPAGAVVQMLAVGEVAPPMMMHTTATGASGAVSWSQRDALDGNKLKMTWQFDSFVQQSAQQQGGAIADTTFKTSLMSASATPAISKAAAALAATDYTYSPQLSIAGGGGNSLYADDTYD